MALDTQSMLLRLSPMSGLDPSGMINASLERQRLQQMQAQLEETRRRNQEDERLRQLAEENEMARAYMADERQKAKIVADARAALLEKRQTAGQKYAELMGKGEVEAAQAMLPYLTSIGSGVEEQGDGRYRYIPDVAADEQQESARLAQTQTYGPDETAEQSLSRLDAMGYPTNERGDLGDPLLRRTAPTATDELLVANPEDPEFDPAVEDALTPGEADMQTSSEFGGDDAEVSVRARGLAPAQLGAGDPYTRALMASEWSRRNDGAPLVREEADATGSVPNDVIDMGATEMSTMRRLKPALSAFVDAYPETHRGSAASTQSGVEALEGMPMTERLKLYQSMRSGPDSAINQSLQLDAQQAKDARVSPADQEALIDRGARRVTSSYTKAQVPGRIDAASSAKLVVELLSDDDDSNDEKAINFLMNLSRNKGHQTEMDALRMTGDNTLSTIDQLLSWFHRAVEGGFWGEQKISMINFAERLMNEDRDAVFNWFDTERDKADKSPSRDAGEGAHGFLDSVYGTMPAWLREQYEAREPEDDGADAEPDADRDDRRAAGGGDDFQTELMVQAADADIDSEKLMLVIGPESGGDGRAVNDLSGATGIIQFMPETARELGTSVEELRKMSATEQIPYALEYLRRWGVNADSPPEDYAMAVAAPKFIGKSDDTVVYKKGTKAWKDNKPWRPDDGGDITVGSILRFYGLRDEAPGGGALPEAATDLDAEVLDILR